MILPRYFFYQDFTQYRDLILMNGGQKEDFKAGTTLLEASNVSNTMYYIDEGVAKVVIYDKEGLEHTQFYLGNGCIWPINLLDDAFSLESYMFLVSATALKTITFSQEQLKKMITMDPSFSFAVINHYARQGNLLMTKNMLSDAQNSQQSVCTFLYLYYINNPGSSDVLDLKQKDICSATGISQATVTRILTKLKEEQLIQVQRGKIRILNDKKLQELSNVLANMPD